MFTGTQCYKSQVKILMELFNQYFFFLSNSFFIFYFSLSTLVVFLKVPAFPQPWQRGGPQIKTLDNRQEEWSTLVTSRSNAGTGWTYA
jgi:hypothetical protein